MYVPLQIHSDYSLGYGTASVDELVSEAVDMGFSAIALTDLETLAGQPRLHKVCRASGLKAISGVELRAGITKHKPFGDLDGRLVLIAQNKGGYENICQILSDRHQKSNFDLLAPLMQISADMSGIFYLTDDAKVGRGLLDRGVNGEQIRLLIVRPASNNDAEKMCITLALETGIKLVASSDTVLITADDMNLHLLQTAWRLDVPVAGLKIDRDIVTRKLYNVDQFGQIFANNPELISETLLLSEQCQFDLTATELHTPAPDQIDETSAQTVLYDRCVSSLATSSEEYLKRLTEEIAVINERHLAGYFLTVAEIADEIKRRGIGLAGRGSAAGSLVAYLLGLTACDPIAHGLYFERFLHRYRPDLPDIDIDVAWDRREEILQWLTQRFGDKNVAMVCAYQNFQEKSALHGGLKYYGASSEEMLTDTQRQTINRLVGKPHHISVHPGGIVVTRDAIARHAPLERAPKGVLVTQYDMHAVKLAGLVKIDLLGNRCLSAIDETIQLVAKDNAWPFDLSQGRLAIPEDDLATLQKINQGDVIGCFQLESPAMRSVLRRMPIQSMTDIVSALAIVRPGPASGEAKTAFIRRACALEPATFLHPAVGTILSSTHGLPLFEEDIMQVLAKIAGLSLAKADLLRQKILDAYEQPDRLLRLRQRFISAAAENGLTDVEPVWDMVCRFANYSFNKAHATSYSILGYQTAYLKTHFPTHFACAILNHYGGMYATRTLVADFMAHGVEIAAPDINLSGNKCKIENGHVRFALSSIKGLTKKAIAKIIEQKSQKIFSTLYDFLQRTSPGAKEVEALILSGACDSLPPLSAVAYPYIHQSIIKLIKEKETIEFLQSMDQVAVAVAQNNSEQKMIAHAHLSRIFNELKFLAAHPSGHPMLALRPEAKRYGCTPIGDAVERADKTVKLAVLVSAGKEFIGQDQIPMQFLTLEDETGLLEARLSQQFVARISGPITDPGPFMIIGVMREDLSDHWLEVTDLLPFHQRLEPFAT